MEMEKLAEELAETLLNGNLTDCKTEIRGHTDCCLLAILVFERLPADSRALLKRLLWTKSP